MKSEMEIAGMEAERMKLIYLRGMSADVGFNRINYDIAEIESHIDRAKGTMSYRGIEDFYEDV